MVMADLECNMEVLIGGTQTSLKGEDCFSLVEAAKVGDDSCTFFVLADGHGGRAASAHITTALLSWIVQHAEDGSVDALNRAAVAGFAEMHSQVCAQNTTAGSTCTVCCLNATRREVSSWNVGDSLALLVYDDGYVELGQSHRLEDNPSEQERVVAAGAKLGRATNSEGDAGGPIRAYPGGLAVTRCIGDSDCMFVIPEPAFSTCPMPEAGGALVACSDGVWDHLEAQEAATSLLTSDYDGATSAAGQIVQAAISRGGLTDDTTALCMLFGPPLTAEPDLDSEPDSPMARRPASSFIKRRTSRASHEPAASAAGARVLTRAQTSSVLGALSAQTGEDAIAASVRGGNLYAPRFVDHASVRGGNMFASVARHSPPSFPRSPQGRADGMLAPEAQRVVWAAEDRQSAVTEPAGESQHSPPRTAEGSSPALKLTHKSSAGSNLTQMFDNMLNSYNKRSSNSLNRSRSMNGSRSLSSSREGSGTNDDRWNTTRRTQALPWHGQGVTSASAPSNRSPEGTGWKRNERPTPSPTWQSVDAKMIASYEQANGARTARPSNVVTFAELGALKYLGEGEFATAHAIELKGKRLAVKMLKPANRGVPSAVSGIKREIMLMNLMRHPHVLSCEAIGEHEGIPFVVLEVLSSVLSHDLPRPADAVPFWVRQREVKQWPLSRALSYGAQLASALQYCHDDAFPGYRVLHRDIKPNNVGFIASGRLVIFDFGLASLWELYRTPADELPRKLTGETGSLRYMAPEVALAKSYTHRAEVFSFALVLWEMAAHQKPHSGYTSEGQFKGALLRGVVPPIAKQWPASLGSLLTECWAPDEAQRPEFCSIVPRLKVMQVATRASEEDVMQSGGCFGRASKGKVAPLPS